MKTKNYILQQLLHMVSINWAYFEQLLLLKKKKNCKKHSILYEQKKKKKKKTFVDFYKTLQTKQTNIHLDDHIEQKDEENVDEMHSLQVGQRRRLKKKCLIFQACFNMWTCKLVNGIVIQKVELRMKENFKTKIKLLLSADYSND